MEIILQAITEKLQEIDNKIENLNTPKENGDIENIKEMLSKYFYTIRVIDENIREISEISYTYPLNEIKQQIKQLEQDFNKEMAEIKRTNKQKLKGIHIISGLVLLIIISVMLNFRFRNKIDVYRLNSTKYRYMQMLGNDVSYNATLVTDSIFKKYDHKSIENAIEEREYLIRKKVEAEMRLKATIEKAQELKSETNRLNSLLK